MIEHLLNYELREPYTTQDHVVPNLFEQNTQH
jgi:hypothetical protein